AQAVVSAPAGSVSIEGQLGRLFPGVRWQARVVASGLDPGRDWRALPRGRVDFTVSGSGARDAGELIVDQLTALAAGVRVEGHGHSDFGGHGAGELRAHLDSLARLGDLGVRVDGVDELDGEVALEARLGRDAAGPRVEATLH